MNISEIWTLIVKTNTFNFIFLVLILGGICKLAKVGTLLSNAQNKVKTDIDTSEKTKEASIEELEKTKESIKNLQNEIDDIFDKSKENAENFKRKTAQEIEIQQQQIMDAASKTAQSEQTKLVSSLSTKTALAVVEVVKNHLIDVLAKNPKYHQKFIEESIQKLDRLNY